MYLVEELNISYSRLYVFTWWRTQRRKIYASMEIAEGETNEYMYLVE